MWSADYWAYVCGYKCAYVSKASAVRDSLIHGVRESFMFEVHDSFICGVQTIVPICMDMNVHICQQCKCGS